jgi:16S rRNA (adenine(1408)-N(1))-methyltransferase
VLLVRGKDLVEVGAAEVDALLAGHARAVVDVGTGDGRLPYALARSDPSTFYLGVDATPENLRETSRRATRKPSRGGVPNVAFAVAAAEHPPAELAGRFDEVKAILPWGRLMVGLITSDPDVLRGLGALARPGGRMHVVLNGEVWGDPIPVEARDLPEPTVDYVREVLTPAYAPRGIELGEPRAMTPAAIAGLPSTWARKLSHGRAEPRFVEFEGRVRSGG